MRRIKKWNIFELKSSTYSSAADKLKDLHPDRAKKLRDKANELDSDINYLDPRTFEINNDYYHITDIKYYPKSHLQLDQEKLV